MLDLGPVAIRRPIDEGGLPYHRSGGGYRFKRAEIEKYRDERGGDQTGAREPGRPTPLLAATACSTAPLPARRCSARAFVGRTSGGSRAGIPTCGTTER